MAPEQREYLPVSSIFASYTCHICDYYLSEKTTDGRPAVNSSQCVTDDAQLSFGMAIAGHFHIPTKPTQEILRMMRRPCHGAFALYVAAQAVTFTPHEEN